MDTRSSTFIRVAAWASIVVSCCSRISTEPAALLAATPEREYLGAEKIFAEKLGTDNEAADNSSQVMGADSEAFDFDLPRTTKVVIWSKFIMKNGNFMKRHVPKCTLKRAFSFDFPGADNRSLVIDQDYDISDADVVVFNLAPLEQNYVLPRHKPKGQLWVAGCWEPISFDGDDILGDCSLMNDQATMSQMDGVASYHNNSLFPAFFTPPTEAQLRRPAPDFGASGRQELATYVSSDCRVPWRDGWVATVNQALVSKGLPGVLSYGKCLKSASEVECSGPEAVQEPTDADDTVEEWVFAKFANRCMARPFALVAENSMNPWYVTEKIWNALATGAIPVYLGPPQVKDLLPPGSVIFSKDYESPQQMVDTLLNFGEEDFARARAWKSGPTSQWGMWSRARTLSRATLLPRLCAAGAHRAAVGGLVDAPQASAVAATPPPQVMVADALDVQPALEVVTASPQMPDGQHALALGIEATRIQTADAVAQSQTPADASDMPPVPEEATALPRTPDVQHALALSVEAAEVRPAEEAPRNRTATETLAALGEVGDLEADVARSTVTSIDDFLRRSDKQEAEAMQFLKKAVSKIRAGHALRRSTTARKQVSIDELGKEIDDFEKSLGGPAQKGARI